MEKIKKLVSLILALVLVMGLTVPALAEEGNHSLTIKNTGKTPHTFELYQIFKGDYDLNTKKLSNIDWGNGVNITGGFTYDSSNKTFSEDLSGTAAKTAEILTAENVEEFAKVISKNLQPSSTSQKVEAGQSHTFNLSAGYYLVKDKDSTQTGENSAYTQYLLKVVESVNATTKLDVPTVTKHVKDINDSTDTNLSEWQKSADHDFKDNVQFQLKGTLPENYEKYTTYKYVFHDKGSKGLTFDEKSVVVYVDDVKIDNSSNDKYVVKKDVDNFTVTFEDLKKSVPAAKNKSVIRVEYQAELNENAVIGKAGNPNEVYLEYSNNPNGEGTGQTPKDKVIVFTYKTIVNKVNEMQQALQGAGFTLYKKLQNGTWNKIGDEKKGGEMTKFEFEGLDDGDYKLVETTVPSGYNKMADLLFTITATHDEKVGTKEALKTLNGNVENGSITFTPNVEEGSLSADVENKPGSTLPETGGLGTKLLYILGTIFTIVAVGYLFAEKKVLRNQNR